jgi:hypothetical protein
MLGNDLISFIDVLLIRTKTVQRHNLSYYIQLVVSSQHIDFQMMSCLEGISSR